MTLALEQREKHKAVLAQQSSNLAPEVMAAWIAMIVEWERDMKNAPSPYAQVEESTSLFFVCYNVRL